MEIILEAYLRFRAENILAPGADPREAEQAEQQAFDDAIDSPRNGTVAAVYPPAFERYLAYKGISREVVQPIDLETPGRKPHGS